MANLNVAVIGRKGYGREIGKKGTESDITFYNFKKGSATITAIEPTSYPEKLSPLFYSISVSEVAIFAVSSIDAYLGEAMIAVDTIGIENAIFVLENVSEEEIKPFLKEFRFKAHFVENPAMLREFLMEMVLKKEEREAEKGTVAIDHFFNVKGVGTVALGTVIEGSIRKHDDLRLYPLNKIVHIRSIQKHDEDFDIANKGDRVGLALKNVSVDELRRGYILSSEELDMETELKMEVAVNRYWKGEIKNGMVFHIGKWMQFIMTRYEDKFILNRSIVFKKPSSFFIAHLDSKPPRIVGKGIVK
jgi:selenocysteine-specific translation elongation factor